MKTLQKIILPAELSGRLSAVYTEIQLEYDRIAEQIGLRCSGCPDNCCDSYFLHYTYAEWAYLWEGLRNLESGTLERIISRARNYIEESDRSLAKGKRPQQMCPLNDNGLCALYSHRLLICRLHGIPATMTRPDGKTLNFPGCFRCQEVAPESCTAGELPAMNRTSILGRVAAIESELLGGKRHLFPRVRKTIAAMIADGPPTVDKLFCRR